MISFVIWFFSCENSLSNPPKIIIAYRSYTGMNYKPCGILYANRNFYGGITNGLGMWSTGELKDFPMMQVYAMESTSSTISFKFNLSQNYFNSNGINWLKSQNWFFQIYGLDF